MGGSPVGKAIKLPVTTINPHGQPYVSSEPNHSAPRHGEPETSAGDEPIYGDDSSRVSSDVGFETEATSREDQSESTTSKDKAKSKQGYTSRQSTTKSSEYSSPENETRYSSTDSTAAESPKYGSLPTESSEDTRSTGVSLSDRDKVATTPASFAVLQKCAEEPKATDATQSWTTMASKTTKTLASHLDFNGAVNKGFVPDPRSKQDIALQRKRAMDLAPVTDEGPDYKICTKGKNYLHPKVWEAVKNVNVSIKQVDSNSLIIKVTITF
ncbi:hypothetical protein FCOIX_722 [Fusarium coicis]|nr:hypothetical protein FCOIX_722 [Fusarium coicis]